MAEGMTKEQLEYQKKQKAKYNPAKGDTPQARTAQAIGSAVNTAATAIGLDKAAQTAAELGASGAFQKEQVAPSQTAPPKSPLRPKQNTQAPAQPPAMTGQQAFLAKGGVNAAAQGQDPTVFNENAGLRGRVIRGEEENLSYRTNPALRGAQQALPNTELGRAGKEFLANSQDVNLGNFGTQGGPNIYGRASTPGGRLDTFTGAGTPDAKSPTTVYNPTGYDNANPYGGAQANAAYGASARRPVNSSLRAGQAQFGQGGGGVRTTELRRINQQANRAFNNALESGMNTKAALRVADNIRAGAGILTDKDQNDASRYGSDRSLEGAMYASDASMANASLREQGAMTRAQDAAARRAADAQFDLLGQQFVDEDGKQDTAGFARMVNLVGGRERLQNASADTQQRLMTRGSAVNTLLERFNEFANEQGIQYSTLGDLTQGMQLVESGATIVDAMSSPNVSLFDIWGEKVRLPDGSIYPVSEVFSDENGDPIAMSAEDWDALVDLSGE